MLWRDHKRMAARMAKAFNLPRQELIDGSVEPDRKRTLTHTWPKARRATRAALYRARRAFLRGNLKRTARFLGIVSHYIADGMVHETIDTYHRAKDHSRIEGDLGGMVEISALPVLDLADEGLVDGEFVFAEIDALVRDGLDRERLGRALTLIGSAVIGPTEAPEELIATRRNFTRRINHFRFKVLGLAAAAAAIAGFVVWRMNPIFLLPLPFCLLAAGRPALFRLLSRRGWILAAAALGALIDKWFNLPYLVLTLILAGLFIYLRTVPDLSRLSEKWYSFEKRKEQSA